MGIELSEEETSWFTHWKHEHATAMLPVEHIAWWGESDLMRLLLMPENKETREYYFQQQHFTQIREMHGMLKHLLDEIGTQPPEAMSAFALRQDFKKANLRYKEDVYIPQHTKIRILLVAFDNCHTPIGP